MEIRQPIRLLPDLIARCERHGHDRVARYAGGFNRGSRALSSHGAERDPVLQGKSMMAECALCHWAGVDIETLHWNGGYADSGIDIVFGDRLVDVKSTARHCHYLIWPVNKRPIFHTEPFNTLVLVKEEVPDFWISGWISKEEFWDLHQEEPASSPHRLTPGTWFVHEDQLHPMWIIARAEFTTVPSWHPSDRSNPWA